MRRHRRDLIAAAAAHGVRNLRVFGSVARGEDRPDSDVDLLAEFPPGLSLFGLGRLEADLEAILGTHVDLIQAAIDAIRSHLQRGDLSDGLVFDTCKPQWTKTCPTSSAPSKP